MLFTMSFNLCSYYIVIVIIYYDIYVINVVDFLNIVKKEL